MVILFIKKRLATLVAGLFLSLSVLRPGRTFGGMKKFLRSLSRKDITKYLVLLLLLATGRWLGGYGGGVLSGAAGFPLVFGIIGKAIFAGTIARIDKQVKDHIVNHS